MEEEERITLHIEVLETSGLDLPDGRAAVTICDQVVFLGTSLLTAQPVRIGAVALDAVVALAVFDGEGTHPLFTTKTLHLPYLLANAELAVSTGIPSARLWEGWLPLETDGSAREAFPAKLRTSVLFEDAVGHARAFLAPACKLPRQGTRSVACEVEHLQRPSAVQRCASYASDEGQFFLDKMQSFRICATDTSKSVSSTEHEVADPEVVARTAWLESENDRLRAELDRCRCEANAERERHAAEQRRVQASLKDLEEEVRSRWHARVLELEREIVSLQGIATTAADARAVQQIQRRKSLPGGCPNTSSNGMRPTRPQTTLPCGPQVFAPFCDGFFAGDMRPDTARSHRQAPNGARNGFESHSPMECSHLWPRTAPPQGLVPPQGLHVPGLTIPVLGAGVGCAHLRSGGGAPKSTAASWQTQPFQALAGNSVAHGPPVSVSPNLVPEVPAATVPCPSSPSSCESQDTEIARIFDAFDNIYQQFNHFARPKHL